MHLNRISKVPLHIQLRNLLQQEVIEGAYEPGEPFPTEREIAERFHVSRTTIREAVAGLVRLGYLVRQQGKGTFVARSHDAFDATKLSSFTEDMRKRGKTAGASLLTFEEQEANEPSRRHFGDATKTVLCVRRLRLADGQPIAIQTSYLPLDQFDLSAQALGEGSLYALLLERYGVDVSSADEVIAATCATKEQAELLAIASGEALLCVDRYAYSQTGQPIEYVQILYRADQYKFFVHQLRGG